MNFRQMFLFAIIATAALIGCTSAPGPVHMTEVECRLNSDCEVGEYCDSFTNLCGWDCQNDLDCAIGSTCDLDNGRCIRAEEPAPVECESDDECAPGMYCDLTQGECLREEMPPPVVEDGATALVVEFAPRYGHLVPNVGWNDLGTVEVEAFGGDIALGAITISGANFGRFDSFALVQDGLIVTAAVVTETITRIPLSTPAIVGEGERVSFEVVGRLRTPAEYFGMRITVSPEGAAAAPVEGSVPTRVVLNRVSESEFRLWQSVPSVTRQALSTTTLANGIDLDLYRVQIAASVTAPVTIGSLSFRLMGLTGTLSNFRVRVGSTDLPLDAFRIQNTHGAPIDLRSGTLDTRGPGTALTENITVVFTDGLLVVGSGVVVTLHATTAEFEAGSSLMVRFGDRDFEGLSGDITPDGKIHSYLGTYERIDTDAIVWTDGTRPDVWTGSWGIHNLDEAVTLTR